MNDWKTDVIDAIRGLKHESEVKNNGVELKRLKIKITLITICSRVKSKVLKFVSGWMMVSDLLCTSRHQGSSPAAASFSSPARATTAAQSPHTPPTPRSSRPAWSHRSHLHQRTAGEGRSVSEGQLKNCCSTCFPVDGSPPLLQQNCSSARRPLDTPLMSGDQPSTGLQWKASSHPGWWRCSAGSCRCHRWGGHSP